mmetsp:Transcript_12418/g.36588  ORF Transcript_12418/g.36588 Transcript_12418/m.36588 type:complete len:204 (+) Transcript_12418:323-934(+)
MNTERTLRLSIPSASNSESEEHASRSKAEGSKGGGIVFGSDSSCSGCFGPDSVLLFSAATARSFPSSVVAAPLSSAAATVTVVGIVDPPPNAPTAGGSATEEELSPARAPASLPPFSGSSVVGCFSALFSFLPPPSLGDDSSEVKSSHSHAPPHPSGTSHSKCGPTLTHSFSPPFRLSAGVSCIRSLDLLERLNAIPKLRPLR